MIWIQKQYIFNDSACGKTGRLTLAKKIHKRNARQRAWEILLTLWKWLERIPEIIYHSIEAR